MRQLTGISLLLILTSTCSDAEAQQASKKLKFATGETTVEASGDKDHVVIKDAQGKKTSESWCDSGEFDAYLSLFTKLKDSVGRGDRAAVVKMVAYPLRVNAKKPQMFRNELALSKAYDKVFTPPVQETIGQAEPAAVFCRDGQGMLGDGVVWAVVANGTAKAVVVNQ